jgi:GNAT superfamily N-acetyltransferase
VELIPAAETDWERAWAIQKEVFKEVVWRTSGGWTEAEVQKCRAAWKPEQTRLILVEGQLAGWLRLEKYPDHRYLDLIVMDRKFQGKGIGSKVIQQLIQEAEGLPIWLSVYRTNKARMLYQRLGFAELERDPTRIWMVYPDSTPLVPPGR